MHSDQAPMVSVPDRCPRGQETAGTTTGGCGGRLGSRASRTSQVRVPTGTGATVMAAVGYSWILAPCTLLTCK